MFDCIDVRVNNSLCISNQFKAVINLDLVRKPACVRTAKQTEWSHIKAVRCRERFYF